MSLSPPSLQTHDRAPRDAGLSLTAAVTTSFQIDVVPGLFRHSNDALAAAWGRARRLAVVHDSTVGHRGELLASYLRAARHRDVLDDFTLIETTSGAVNGLNACGWVVESAMKARLGRRDAFVAFGSQRTGQMVAVAAASFRRYTQAVRVHRDLAAVVASVRDGVRATLEDDPISALQRSTRVIVDEDGVQAQRAVAAPEHAALTLLALLDPLVLDQLGRPAPALWRAEGLSAVLRLFRRVGPGHRVWGLGEEWLALAPPGLEPIRRRVWSLLLAASVSHRLGLLSDVILRDVSAIAARQYPGLSDQSGVAAEPDAARRWSAGQFPADGHAITVCLPTGGDAEEVTVDRAFLEPVLTAAPPAHRSPRIPAAARQQPEPVSHVVIGARTGNMVLASFPVRFTDSLLDPARGALADLLPRGCRVLAVVDPYRPEQLGEVHRLLSGYRERGHVSRFAVLPLAATGHAKTLTEARLVVHEAEGLGLTSGDRLLVIGGGTVMDITGYAAYLYRGQTPYIRVPTTLVGMIDAGIGLKVGVNVGNHKNLLGAYHPPAACVCDAGFLRTLPMAERRCGLAEAIKISSVCDAGLFDLIDQHHADVLAGRDTPEVRAILTGSISSMLRELEANPFEEDVRRLPDFGHEFGHALESLSRYRLRHGEAVAIGMALSSCLATAAGYLPRDDLRRILALLRDVGLAVYDAVCDPDVMWRKLHDEVLPHKAGHLHLVVPRAIGTGGFIDSIDEIRADMLRDACRELRAWNAGERP